MYSRIRTNLLYGFITVSMVPLGILGKKLFRRYVPSKGTMVNPIRRAPHDTLLRVSAILSGLGIFVIHRSYKSARYIVAPLFVWVLGWNVSCIGLTGGIASGKSTASTYLAESRRCKVIDADRIAREVVAKGTPGLAAIVSAFGPDVLLPQSGELDRRALGEKIFSDRQSKKRLESITHPRIVRRMLLDAVRYRLSGWIVVLDVPLLFESMKSPLLYLLCSECILVDADPHTQRTRLRARNPELSDEEIERRINSQLSRGKKLEIADYVVENDRGKPELFEQLDRYFT